ncbi:MAG: 1-deoxy-D-xylulose-5-phosphate synthase [Planctomycetota bacterium]
MGDLLDYIHSPADLKEVPDERLAEVAEALRGIIIDVVSRRGGHLASNLGVAELTVALHRIFEFPRDRLLWDVGHQCYAHKLLTGRRARFDSLRQGRGLSGFPDPDESPYDLFKVGHAGTAISTAVGMALADTTLRPDSRIVAVVGDASIVNGLSLEGINNAALLNRQLLVVLNDNSMAIDVTPGAMARALDGVRLTRTYRDFKDAADSMLRRLPGGQNIGDALRHLREGLRTAVHGQQAFEALGFRYFGPVDGHNLPELLHMLRRVADLDTPVLLHVHTVKGRGYEYAVEDPTTFHSPASWTIESGKAVFARPERPSWTSAFGEALVAAAEADDRICALTAAMPDGTGLVEFRKRFPDRYHDVGISESHAVAMAAGLAKAGMRPVVAIYSTFMQRAMDQVCQEAALQGLPIVFCLDRAGLVGSDGAVHHGFLDIALFRGLPGMTLMAPADGGELDAALRFALTQDGPTMIRYPRDQVPPPAAETCPPFERGRGRVLRDGAHGTFLCYGAPAAAACDAAERLADEGVAMGVVSARFAKPLDEDLLATLLTAGRPVITCEDHARPGGFGEAVLEAAHRAGLPTERLVIRSLPDRFIAHAGRGEQLHQVGLDADGLARAARDALAPRPRTDTPWAGAMDSRG